MIHTQLHARDLCYRLANTNYTAGNGINEEEGMFNLINDYVSIILDKFGNLIFANYHNRLYYCNARIQLSPKMNLISLHN